MKILYLDIDALRPSFACPSAPPTGVVQITADSHSILWVNDHQVGRGTVPTLRGPIHIAWHRDGAGQIETVRLEAPAGVDLQRHG